MEAKMMEAEVAADQRPRLNESRHRVVEAVDISTLFTKGLDARDLFLLCNGRQDYLEVFFQALLVIIDAILQVNKLFLECWIGFHDGFKY
jgi:hypothetical protein